MDKMKSILKSSIFENGVLIKTFNKNFKVNGYQEDLIKVDNNSEQGIFTEIAIDGLRIVIRDLKTKDHTIRVQHNFPFFKLQFEIEGSSNYMPLNKKSTQIYIPSGHYNLFYLPHVDGVLHYKTNYRKTLEIMFTEKYIHKIIGDDFKKTLLEFGKAITKQESFLMWKTSNPITPELQSQIDKIINCKYPKELKKPYLEAKINELLIYLLAQTNSEKSDKTVCPIHKETYTNIISIESYIKQNLHKPLTIDELASHFGMNKSKLKYDFKTVFSSSIFKHITQLRMEKAKHLIVEKNYNITEASYEVGYKHSQHFTVAFKKTYGYLPSNLIKHS
ncbi:helix-turn-helix domain-containing protein [Wenyingzhuangia sp. IMCC45467]